MENEPRKINFSKIGDAEIGYISVAEKNKLPFKVKRIYWTYFTPENVKRGGHSHIELEQILIAVSGKIELEIETSNFNKHKFILDNPDEGVYIPKRSWRTMKYTHNAVQICIASEEYDEKDYINNYRDFLEMSNGI